MSSAPPSDKTLTVQEIAVMLGVEWSGDDLPAFSQVQSLEYATINDVSFFRAGMDEAGHKPGESDYKKLKASLAGLLLVDKECPALDRPCIVVKNPSLAATILAQFWQNRRTFIKPGIHPTAVIEQGALIDPTASIGAHCFVGRHSTIGAKSILYPSVVVYDNVTIGEECVIHANTTIGGDGFGYSWDGEKHIHMPQTGGVAIGRAVEIGSNCCIDSGTFQPTQIGDGCIIDNLVQIGHNVSIGRFAVLCGQVGISGSVEVGDGVIFAGKSGAAGHISIGEGAKIAARAAVMTDIRAGDTVAGHPAVDLKLHQKMLANIRRAARHV